MPHPQLSSDLLQQAIDAVELAGGNVKQAGIDLKLPASTFRNRVLSAQRRGIKPSVKKHEIKPSIRQRLGRMHMVIPDCQVRGDVPTEHLEWETTPLRSAPM